MAYKLPFSMRPPDLDPYSTGDIDTFRKTNYDSLNDEDKIKFRDDFISEIQSVGLPRYHYMGDVDLMVEKIRNSKMTDKFCEIDTNGNLFLDEHFPHRLSSSHAYMKSAEEAWADAKFMQKAFDMMVSEDRQFNIRAMYNNLIHIIKAPGHFRPRAAASVINHLKAKNVLDPFIGWGGRALASMLCPSVKSYFGMDLQRESVDGVLRIQAELKDFTKVDVNVKCGDSIALMKEMDNEFDLILTSPPFWRAESYNGVEQTNSLDSWYQSFVLPFAYSCTKLLSKNGNLVLHMEDSLGKPLYSLFHRALTEAGLKSKDVWFYNKDTRPTKQRMLYVYSK